MVGLTPKDVLAGRVPSGCVLPGPRHIPIARADSLPFAKAMRFFEELPRRGRVNVEGGGALCAKRSQ